LPEFTIAVLASQYQSNTEHPTDNLPATLSTDHLKQPNKQTDKSAFERSPKLNFLNVISSFLSIQDYGDYSRLVFPGQSHSNGQYLCLAESSLY
jgi:hypothetical protein